MEIFTEGTLSCGHRLTFYTPGMGALPTDVLPHVKSESVQAAYRDLFTKHYPAFRPTRVLEIGVERGGSLALWQESFKCPVVGVDRNLEQVEKAVHAHFEEKLRDVTLVSMTILA
jgi:hypothetical protein